jgi:hypothetical protein
MRAHKARICRGVHGDAGGRNKSKTKRSSPLRPTPAASPADPAPDRDRATFHS